MTQERSTEQTLYSFSAKNASQKDVSLSEYKGKVLLIVNVASECGFTVQYEGLQSLYTKFKDRGFEILAFPCNQFGGQEPGNDEQIAQFCTTKFKTSFPLFSKIDVNGSAAHPLFDYLKKKAPGLMGSQAIKWNFTKFLIDREGNIVDRFAPTTKPEELEAPVSALL